MRLSRVGAGLMIASVVVAGTLVGASPASAAPKIGAPCKAHGQEKNGLLCSKASKGHWRWIRSPAA